jgi:hypothetical protein
MKNKMKKKSIRKYKIRKRIKFNSFKYDFRFIQEMYFIAIYKNIGRKMSLYDIKYKDRVFHKNMVNGLCFGRFYGRNKVIFKRKEFKNKKILSIH